jgi:hypothetical protein
MRPHIHTLAEPAASASSRYTTNIAVSSAPRDAGERKPAQVKHMGITFSEHRPLSYAAYEPPAPRQAPAGGRKQSGVA